MEVLQKKIEEQNKLIDDLKCQNAKLLKKVEILDEFVKLTENHMFEEEARKKEREAERLFNRQIHL